MKNSIVSLYKLILIGTMLFMLIFLCNISVFASADNSLAKLNIEGIELEPEFKYSRLKYTATVENEITDVEVSALPSNKAAKILSISGNKNLAVGENTINIIVQAKNGRKVTYSITLTRKGISDSEAHENTKSKKENKSNKKKFSPKELEEKIRKKNKKIKKLNETIDNLNTEIQENQTKYDQLLKENQKIYSQRIFMILIILLLFFSFLVALFIGNIKTATNNYLKQEFGYHTTKTDSGKIKEKSVGTSSDNTEEYATMDRKPRLNKNNENLLSNIETVIANEIRMNEQENSFFINPESSSLQNKLSNTEEKTKDTFPTNQETEENLDDNSDDFLQKHRESEKVEDKKDDFSFDIIEI